MVATLDEQTLLDEAVERLTDQYPSLAPSVVSEVVRELHATFAGARVRDFVPLFVERRARLALAELSVSYEGIPATVG